MVRLRPGWMAVVALLSAAALAGCASDRGSRQTACCCESSQPVTQAVNEPRPGSEVRLAAFETGGSAGASPSESEVSPAQFTEPRPAEVVVAPDPNAIDGDRRSLPLDLPTALGMTQGQNPRVVFAQAQIAQSLAIHDAARALWLPSIRAGGNYNKHEGRIQQVAGDNIIASRGAAFGGFGAN